MAWTADVIVLLGLVTSGVCGSSFLTPLANYVKSRSDPDVPPQQDVHTPVQVSFAFAMMNIADVDKEHNTFTTESFVGRGWNTGITWNPADYGGADRITLPKKYFWTPHMQTISTAVEVKDLGPGLVTLLSNGTASFNQVFRLQGLCDVSHIETGASCHGRRTLWGYSTDQVNIAAIGREPTGTIPFFEGSKYQVTGFNLGFIDIVFDNKHYKILNNTMDIKAKPQAGHGPMNLHFEWH